MMSRIVYLPVVAEMPEFVLRDMVRDQGATCSVSLRHLSRCLVVPRPLSYPARIIFYHRQTHLQA